MKRTRSSSRKKDGIQVQVAPSKKAKLKQNSSETTIHSPSRNKEDRTPPQSAPCSRCGAPPSTKRKCEIPHPVHLRLSLEKKKTFGKVLNYSGYTTKFQCLACLKTVSIVRPNGTKNEVILDGPTLCFKGKHSSTPLPGSDKSRIYKGLVRLTSLLFDKKNIQEKIEETLSPENQEKVEILCIPYVGGGVSLCHRMSNLTTLQLGDFSSEKIHLTAELTPKLTHLDIGCIEGDCSDFKVIVPTLKKVLIHCYLPSDHKKSQAINDMLKAASKLESFVSHNMLVEDELFFASNYLDTICIDGSNELGALSIWAPNLKKLVLKNSYRLDKITILKSHPKLSKELPKRHKRTQFTVSTTRCNISPSAVRSLKMSGRCVIEEVDDVENPERESEIKHQKEFRKENPHTTFAMRLKERGNYFFNEGQYKDALSYYNSALLENDLKHTDSAIVYKNQAACFLKAELYEMAVEAATISLKITPNDPKALFRRIQAYESIKEKEFGNLDSACTDAANLVRVDPKNKPAKILFNRLNDIVQESWQNMKIPECTAYQDVTEFGYYEDTGAPNTKFVQILILGSTPAGFETQYLEENRIGAKATKIVKKKPCSALKKKKISDPCKRCLQSRSIGKCQVPHPDHLQEHSTCSTDGYGKRKDFKCLACSKQISVIEKQNIDNSVIVSGPKLCFNGKHISTDLPADDKRRVFKGLVSMGVTDNFQENVNKVLAHNKQANVRILNLSDRGGQCFHINLSLCHYMTNLTTLRLIDVVIKRLHLIEEFTPNLTDLKLQNIGDYVHYEIVLPRLQHVAIHFFRPVEDSCHINDMLRAATKLKTFDGYKLKVTEELYFASNHLETIKLWRSDNLEAISVWAPNLEYLNLQACFNLEWITLLKSHPDLSKELPKRHKPSWFKVNTLNANLSPSALRTLQRSGRCIIEDEDIENCKTAPMEAQLMMMHGDKLD